MHETASAAGAGTAHLGDYRPHRDVGISRDQWRSFRVGVVPGRDRFLAPMVVGRLLIVEGLNVQIAQMFVLHRSSGHLLRPLVFR